MNNELKTCPFCGGAAYINHIEPHIHAMTIGDWKMPDHPGSVVVECSSCDVGIIKDTEAEAVAAWNKRAQPNAKQEG